MTDIKNHMLTPANEPCYLVNPVLWQAYCLVTKRDPMSVSDLWTELDVVNSLLAKARRNDAGTIN